MYQLSVANGSSINLNFLVYVSNMYFNKYNTSLSEKKFPYLPISNEGFLEKEELSYCISKMWNNFVLGYNPNGDNLFSHWDMLHMQKKDLYRKLFKDNDEGQVRFLEVWNSFIVWWNSQGDYIINSTTDDAMPIIAEKVKMYYEKDIEQSPTGLFIIQIVYDIIPDGFLKKGAGFIIEPLEQFKFFRTSNDKISVVAQRLYEFSRSIK